ncbi:histidine kinase dimerization/phosphoacceptor domain -containing protein [Zavarzinia sp. CC-PAN008]|uniref:histidine kinase dimerization/phosphoacceptor domain -containing protein n=1 Tax=Zavarzinia sp. CC-PAN008 TaxID=3243332 RepID=UPI003F744184
MTLSPLPHLDWGAAPDGRWVTVGDGWRALGVEPVDMLGSGWHSLLEPEGAPGAIAALAELAARGGGGCDVAILVGGATRWLRMILAPGNAGRAALDGRAVEVTDLVTAAASADHRVARLQHRIKNNLQVVISLLGLQAHYLKDPTLRVQLEDAVQRVRCVALMQDQVFQAADMTRIPLAPALVALGDQLALGGGVAGGDDAVAEAALPGDRASALVLLCNEVLMSLLKGRDGDGSRHGDEAGGLDLALAGEGGLRIAVRLGEPIERLDPLGERLAGLLARQLRAEIRQEPGAISVIVPLKTQ